MKSVIELAQAAGMDAGYKVDGALPVLDRVIRTGLCDLIFVPEVRGCSFSNLKMFYALIRAENEALLKLAAEALVYHTQMTRPIHKTNEALVAIHEVLAEQSMAMILNDPHPPHRLCECTACLEYWTPLPDCDAFAASGKPIAGQTNTQLMEGFRPVSEMIAEHKQDPKKAAAIEKAKMRKAEQEPVAWRNYNGAVNNRLKTAAPQPVQKPTDCPCCGAKGTVIPSAFCRECKSDFWPPSVPANPTQPD